MTSSSPFYFHIGMFRTATTTFQESLFSAHSDIDYFGKSFKEPILDALVTAIACHDSAIYDRVAAKEIVAAYIDPKRRSGKTALISQELLTSSSSTDTQVIAHRIRDLFGECKIFISIRRQDSILLSYYLQTALKKYNAYYPLKKWLDRNYKFRDYHDSVMHLLHYDELVRIYEDVFGQDNVKVLPYELFIQDKNSYILSLCSYLQIDSTEAIRLLANTRFNSSKGTGYQRGMRLRKTFLPWKRLPWLDKALIGICSLIWRSSHHGMCLPEKWKTLSHDMYAEGNRHLSERHALGLHRYGYY